MAPKTKRKTTTRVTHRTTVAAVRRANYEVLRSATDLAKEAEAIWVARDAACVKPGSFYDFEDSQGSLGKFARQDIVSEQMLQVVNDRFDSFNDFSLIIETVKPVSLNMPLAVKRACTQTNGIDSPLPKADKLSIDVLGDHDDGEVSVEPVAGPTVLASRRSVYNENSNRLMLNLETKKVQTSKSNVSLVSPSPIVTTPAYKNLPKTPLTEVLTRANHRLTSNDLMAIPSQKTVFVSTPVNTNRKSFRIDVSPIVKNACSSTPLMKKNLFAFSTLSNNRPVILPSTNCSSAASSASVLSVLPPTDESEMNSNQITFNDVCTTSIMSPNSVPKLPNDGKSYAKSTTTTIQSLHLSEDKSADMFADSEPGFNDVFMSNVSELKVSLTQVNKMVTDTNISNVGVNSQATVEVETSKLSEKHENASESVFVIPLNSMNTSKAPCASSKKTIDTNERNIELDKTSDAVSVNNVEVPQTSKCLSETQVNTKSFDSMSKLSTPFVSVRKSYRPFVECEVEKTSFVVSDSIMMDKENSVDITSITEPADALTTFDKPNSITQFFHDSDAVTTSFAKTRAEKDEAFNTDAEEDKETAELEIIAKNRVLSPSPVHRCESQIMNQINTDHCFRNDSCRSNTTIASGYTTFTVKVADLNKQLFYLEGFTGEPTELSRLCFVSGQNTVQPWKAAIRQLDLSGVKKIGEGAFGEVYVAKFNGMKVALKVFPFRESEDPAKRYPLINDGEMMPAASIMSEVVVTKTLSALSLPAPNFVPLHKTFVVKGSYPKELLAAWNAYDKSKGSENTSPTFYDSVTRHYMVMALGFGGVNLESYVLRSYTKAMSILLQVALALTVAELELEFEHRDLHWGNILICEEDVPDLIDYVIEGNVVQIKSHGVKVIIIDFTNSRIFKDGVVVYMDLSQDEVLFQGQGDPQFQVYRDMRAINDDDWSLYKPETNALWLDYLVDKLFNGIEGKRPKFAKKLRVEAVKNLAFIKECSSASSFLKQSVFLFADFYESDVNSIFS